MSEQVVEEGARERDDKRLSREGGEEGGGYRDRAESGEMVQKHRVGVLSRHRGVRGHHQARSSAVT